MIIIVALIVLVPGMIAVLFYERFKGYELCLRKRLELFAVFAFVINLIGYVILWLRNWTHVIWTSNLEGGALTASFVVQYMVISAITAVVIAYILTLVRVEKRVDDEEEQDEMSESAIETAKAGTETEKN